MAQCFLKWFQVSYNHPLTIFRWGTHSSITTIKNSLHHDHGHSDPSTPPLSHKVLRRSSQRGPGREQGHSAAEVVNLLVDLWLFVPCASLGTMSSCIFVCSDHLFSLLADISVMEVARPCPIITDTSWTTRYISFFCCSVFGDQSACFDLLMLSGDDEWTIKDLKRSINPTWIFSLGKLNVHQICCQDNL